MNEKPFGESSMSYPSRSRRSSSTSSSSSSEYHRSSDRIPSYVKGDDHLYNVVRTSAPDPFSATDQDNPAGISELRVLHNPDNERSLTAGTDNVAHPPASYQRPLVQGRDLPPIPVETTRSDGTSLFDPPQMFTLQTRTFQFLHCRLILVPFPPLRRPSLLTWTV
ncbi:hypothetical protein D8B26_008402 [Coccidioides posadasii str. Silveira]|uniref:uncharacterized protein n=1 Tax=Coccidioides posadasii (strain RMSCC 757 / Silveira) TaxID=443226 RepID=UPI001BF0FDDE|nr:hypothetical protein D8B26_008402 [Coccidioides posadasii str. Silveira]